MSKKKVLHAIEASHYVVENDTDVAVGQIELLERVTHNAAVQYANFAEDLKPQVAVAGQYLDAQVHMRQAESQLDALESHVASLESLVQELDQWSSELQVKVERLQG